MNVSIVGSGYVGMTVAACLADCDHQVVNVDIDEAVVDAINDGVAAIHEPGLDELVKNTAATACARRRTTTPSLTRRLRFSLFRR